MCGRYQFSAEQSAEILQTIQEVQDKFGTNAVKAMRQGEIVPGCKMPVLLPSEEGPTPELLVWGYRTPKSLIINARAETAAEKPMFAESVQHQRCVIPSTGFYEWDGDKRKFFLYDARLHGALHGRSFRCARRYPMLLHSDHRRQ